MNYMIVSDYGVMLAKTGARLVIRGDRPRLDLGACRRSRPCADPRAAVYLD
jgi:hypothetical protein